MTALAPALLGKNCSGHRYFAETDWIDATSVSVNIALLTILVATIIRTLISIALVRGRLALNPAFELPMSAPVACPIIALAIAKLLYSIACA